MSKANVWRRALSITLFVICTFIAMSFLSLHLQYLGMTKRISGIGGGYSAEPGWPHGPTWVSVDVIQVGILPKEDIIKVIESQYANKHIESISMSGQHFDAEVAAAVIKTKARSVNIVDCDYSSSSVNKLLESARLRIILCSSADAEVLLSIVRKVRPDVKVMSYGDVDSAGTTNRVP